MSGRRAVKFYQADVFTSTVFGGNPVAVVPEAAGLTDGEMQKIAREMNLSETVFVLPVSAPGADVRLRFFTPLQEIVFAGHPVLGAFYILAHIGVISLIEPVTRLHQETHVGVFPVELFVHDGCIRNIFMEQPKPEFLGVVEDPATGSATGALGAYLVKHGVVDVGPTTEIICEQGYEIDRPSRLMVHVHSDEDEIQSVHVGGQAVVVIEGVISL